MQALENEIDQQLLLAEKKARDEVEWHLGLPIVGILGTRETCQGEGGTEGKTGGGNGWTASKHRTFAENGEDVEEGGTEEWEPGFT